MNFIWKFFAKIGWFFLKLRYRIEVKGLDQLQKYKNQGGLLFLPNHTAHVDPLFLSLLLWPTFRFRPVVTDYVYKMGFLRPWMKLMKAVPMPNLESSFNRIKMKKAKDAIQAVSDGLNEGANYLFYPSGKLKLGPKELLGGSSGTQDVITRAPNAHIVLIRVSGLWGSSFSCALTGSSPSIPKTLLNGLKTLLKNGIFFAPRRKMTVEIAVEPPDFPRQGSRNEINRFLEDWYNQYKGGLSEEPLNLVSYSFWKKDLPEMIHHKKQTKKTGLTTISSDTQSRIFKEIQRIASNPELKISPAQRLNADLNLDSLDIAEIIAFLAQKFNVSEVHPENLETVQNVLEIAEQAKADGPSIQKRKSLFSFLAEKERKSPEPPFGNTIPEAFLHTASRMKGMIACGDDLAGVFTYKKFKRAVFVLASHFEKIPETEVGVLLPASAGAYLVIFALLFARKVPVMLNWTLGPRYLEEMVRLSGAKRVLSSERFLEKIAHVEFGSVTNQLELLEEVRESISLRSKLKGALLSLLPDLFAIKSFKINTLQKNDRAVILFTSGTEASPKGVPLTHDNILSNHRSSMHSFEIKATDILYSILPPFHSFGFSLVGVLPLITGIKAAYYPDPTDGFALAEGIERWGVTLFCGAPNFLKGLLAAASYQQLASIRLFVTGAEKAPQELYDLLGNKLIEGYGITECSPVVSLNRLDIPSKGVGKVLDCIEICTIHPETSALLKEGEEGELCIRGPNVFHGYLGEAKSPFIEINGKEWYRSGDIGHLSKDGYIFLSGRLKRFTKIGGEMISLGAIEQVLTEELAKRGEKSKEGPLLAVCAKEIEGQKTELVLFTTNQQIQKETLNEILSQAGFSNLIKIGEVRRIVEFPLLGTGKTNYRELQTLLKRHL